MTNKERVLSCYPSAKIHIRIFKSIKVIEVLSYDESMWNSVVGESYTNIEDAWLNAWQNIELKMLAKLES